MSAFTTGSLTATGSVTLTKPASDTLALVQLSGTYGTVTWVIEGSVDNSTWFPLAAIAQSDGSLVTSTISPTDNSVRNYKVPTEGVGFLRARVTAIASGTADFVLKSEAFVGSVQVLNSNLSSMTFGRSVNPLISIGYNTGAGGAVTQITSRTTGVTLNTVCGAITTDATSLAAAAEATFTVTNSTVAAGDTVVLSLKTPSATGLSLPFVSTVAAGSFNITLTNLHASTADTSASVINFAVIKAVAA